MAAGWRQFLDGLPAAHAAEVYLDDLDLRESVCDYLRAGFERGEPALVVATPEHLASFREGLGGAHDLLVAEDAEALLGRIAVDGVSTAERFGAALDPLLERVEQLAPGKRCRIFGEMVDILARTVGSGAAEELEELWNGLAERHRFSLLCAYRLDVFDRRTQTDQLPQICRTHTHVLAAHDAQRLDRAVEAALVETVGAARTRDVYYVVGDRLRGERVPVAQDALMWVSANLPGVADRVLDSARRHYRRQAAPQLVG